MAEEIVAIYRAEVEQYKRALDDLTGKVSTLEKSQESTAKSSVNMGSAFTKVAGILGVAFSVDAVVAFGKEVVGLAAKAEGVERAFKRVGSATLLNDLRKATRGTVTDLQLMQNAVKASNFKIPLDQLATLFQFAQARARETGESVDYLVDSIILGIGRKSPQILDNLGISAIALREKFGGLGIETASIGDVARVTGEIITEEMSKMGVQADTTADKISQIEVAWVNLKAEVGKQGISLYDALFGDELPFETLVKGTNEYAQAVRNAGDIFRKDYEQTLRVVEGRADREQVLADEAIVRAETLSKLESRLRAMTSKEVVNESNLREFLLKQNVENAVGLQIINRGAATERLNQFLEEKKQRIIAIGIIQEQISVIRNLGKAQVEEGAAGSTEQIRNVFFLSEAIKKLKEEVEAEGTARARIGVALSEIIPLQDELNRLLGIESEATKKAREEREKWNEANKTLDLDSDSEAFKNSDNRIKEELRRADEAAKFIAERKALGLSEQLAMDLKFEQKRADNLIKSVEFSTLSAVEKKDAIIGIEQATVDEQLRIQNEYRTKLDAIEEEAAAGAAAARQTKYDEELKTAQLIIEIAGQLSSALQSINEVMYANEFDLLDKSLEAGQITREEYETKRKSILRKQAADAKAFALLTAVISTAAGVAAQLEAGPAGFVLAALAGVLGAIQIAVIAATPLPTFAQGGYVDERGKFIGASHARGGIAIEAEGGEYITKAAQARKYGDIIEAVNNNTIEKLIRDRYVKPAVDSAMLNGFSDINTSAQLNGLGGFNDMNLLRAMDRHGFAEVAELRLLNSLLSKRLNVSKRGYA